MSGPRSPGGLRTSGERPRVATPCPKLRCALAIVLLPALAACQSAEPLGRIVTPAEVRSIDPPLNPDPKHIIRLYGRAPETLDFRFRIAFASTSQEGDCWNHAGFWEGGGNKAWRYDLLPVRKGEYWEADFVVDRYLPGRCGWRIAASANIVVAPAEAARWDRRKRASGTKVFGVVGDARSRDETAPRCRPGMHNCDEARNRRMANADDSIPVQVHCRIRPLEERISDTFFFCNEFADYKIMHYAKNHTRRIRIDLYDHGTTKPPPSGVPENAP